MSVEELLYGKTTLKITNAKCGSCGESVMVKSFLTHHLNFVVHHAKKLSLN